MKFSTSLLARRKSGNASELFAAGTEIPSDVEVPQHIIDAYLIDESKPRKHVPMPASYSGVRYARPDGTIIDDWAEHQAAEAKRFEEEEKASGLAFYDHTGTVHEAVIPEEEVQFYPTKYVETGSRAQRDLQREQQP